MYFYGYRQHQPHAFVNKHDIKRSHFCFQSKCFICGSLGEKRVFNLCVSHCRDRVRVRMNIIITIMG